MVWGAGLCYRFLALLWCLLVVWCFADLGWVICVGFGCWVLEEFGC